MIRGCGRSSIGVAVEYVASFLANRLETQIQKHFLHRFKIKDGKTAYFIVLDIFALV